MPKRPGDFCCNTSTFTRVKEGILHVTTTQLLSSIEATGSDLALLYIMVCWLPRLLDSGV